MGQAVYTLTHWRDNVGGAQQEISCAAVSSNVMCAQHGSQSLCSTRVSIKSAICVPVLSTGSAL